MPSKELSFWRDVEKEPDLKSKIIYIFEKLSNLDKENAIAKEGSLVVYKKPNDIESIEINTKFFTFKNKKKDFVVINDDNGSLFGVMTMDYGKIEESFKQPKGKLEDVSLFVIDSRDEKLFCYKNALFEFENFVVKFEDEDEDSVGARLSNPFNPMIGTFIKGDNSYEETRSSFDIIKQTLSDGGVERVNNPEDVNFLWKFAKKV